MVVDVPVRALGRFKDDSRADANLTQVAGGLQCRVMRKVWVLLVFGLVPAVVVAGAVLLVGIAIMPPRFVARAAFVVDWETMPSVPSDENAEKVRINWRKAIIADVTSLPKSEKTIHDFLERCGDLNDSQSNRPVVISKLSRWLRVTMAREPDNVDRFTIEMRDNDSKWAEAVVDAVLQDDLSRLDTQAKTGSGVAAGRSWANVAEVIQKKADLEKELRELENTYSRPFDDAVAQRCESIKQELQKLEVDHLESGLSLLANSAGIVFNDSIKVGEATHVERLKAGLGLLVVLVAVGLGGTAGFAGLLTRKGVLAGTTSNAKAIRQPPPINQYEGPEPPPLPRSQPPVIGEDNDETPPSPPRLEPPVIGQDKVAMSPPLPDSQPPGGHQ